MPISYHQSPGRLVIECDAGETPVLLTQSDLARRAGRSPAFVAGKIMDGTIAPCAVTESGINLFTLEALPLVARLTAVRGRTTIELNCPSL